MDFTLTPEHNQVQETVRRFAEKEIAPKAERDPGYLERNNIEVDEEGGRYRQRPGHGNSLGLVKFMFPNQWSGRLQTAIMCHPNSI